MTTRSQYEILQLIMSLEKKGSSWEPKGRQTLTARALLKREWIYAIGENGKVLYRLTELGYRVANTWR